MFERIYLRFNSTHTNMTLVYFYISIIPLWIFMFELIFTMEVCSIKIIILVLFNIINPCRNPISRTTISQFNFSFEKRRLFNISFNSKFPYSKLVFSSLVLKSIPLIEIAIKIYLLSHRCPFPINYFIILLMNTKFLISFTKFK